MKKVNVLWKIYFWFTVALSALGLWSALMKPELITTIGMFVAIVPFVGMYGFCFSRKIAFRKFWKVVFFIYPLSDIVFCAFRFHPYSAEIGLVFITVVYGLVFLLNLPSYIAIYLYAFKRSDVWEPVTLSSSTPTAKSL